MKNNSKVWFLIIGIIILVGGSLGIVTVIMIQPRSEASETKVIASVPVSPTEGISTIVCGPFLQPEGVVGIVKEVGDNYIRFEDGFRLKVKETGSLFLDRRGYFKLGGASVSEGDRTVVSYALAFKEFNPCPGK